MTNKIQWKKLRFDTIAHVIELNQRIRIFKSIHNSIDELRSEISKEAESHQNISADRAYAILMKRLIVEFFTAISSNRDFYKENIVKIDNKNNITNNLIKTYNGYQEEYNKILKPLQTYLKPVNTLRNILNHTNSSIIINSFCHKVASEKYEALFVTDYSYLDEKEKLGSKFASNL